MTANYPVCPVCRDIGWVEGPVTDHFEPRCQIQPCPACGKVDGLTVGEVVFLVVAFILLMALVILAPGGFQ